jgi:hypothetical protein
MDESNDESADVIRQQMEETKVHLAEKFESLEAQVSETVQSTGATVNAIQSTVQSVTSTIRSSVHSVAKALDLHRQLDKHPLLILGGSVAVGYLIARSMNAPSARRSRSVPVSRSGFVETGENTAGQVATDAAAMASAVTAAYESGQRQASRQLRARAIGALVGVVQEAAWRALPVAMEFLGQQAAKATENLNPTPPEGSSNVPPETEEAHRFRVTPSQGFRAGGNF